MELDFSEEINAKKRAGRKSGAQTPVKPSERKKVQAKINQEAQVKKVQKLPFPKR